MRLFRGKMPGKAETRTGGMKKVRLSVLLCLAAAGMALLAGCGKEKGKLDPDNPVTVTAWHYYNGAQQTSSNWFTSPLLALFTKMPFSVPPYR